MPPFLIFPFYCGFIAPLMILLYHLMEVLSTGKMHKM